MLLLVFTGLMVFLAIRGARKTRTMADYALGSQGFPAYVVALSLAASITSAATFVINPGFVAVFGWSAFLAMGLMLPAALFVSLIVLTKSFRRYGASVKAATLAQWMGKRYNSRGLETWFAVLSLLLITFMVLICVGVTKVLAKALDAPELWVLIGFVTVVYGYMMFGGANAMVYTNSIQATLMIAVAVILLASGLPETGGLWQRLSAIDPMLTSTYNPASPLFRDWFEVVFCNAVVGIAIVCQPHIITRSLLLRRDGDVNRYLVIAIVVQTLFFMVLLTGFFARLRYPELQREGQALPLDGIVPAYVVDTFPVYVGLLVILGLVSAGLSTLEGLIQSLSTTITTDLLFPLSRRLRERDDPAQAKRVNRLVIGGLAIATCLWSYQQLLYPNLSVGILAQNGVYAFFAAAFVPVLLGIYGKNVRTAAPAAASVTAIVVHFSVYYGGLTPYTNGAVRNPAVACTLAILAALTVGLLVQAGRRRSTQNA
ncbi:MAG: sodium:solute symporter [Saprospiraceae bacterium]|nr:sodium:solute symporter [Saprospiraceae bacterium]